MERITAALLAVFCAYFSFGQTLRVINDRDKSPVSDVFVYNDQQSANSYSDEFGIIDLTAYADDDLLHFQHPAYKAFSARKEEVLKSGSIQLTEKIISFDDVVIAANKWEQDASEVSQQVLAIESKSITQSNPQTTADLLSNSGQVFVQKSQYGGGSPILRGFAANKVLLVIDGVRLNNGIYRSGNLQNVINIDANAIEQTEVVFGPGSVIYGSDALGGVMDFTTNSPIFSESDQMYAAGGMFVRFASASDEKTGHIDINLGKEKFAYRGSYSQSDFGDLQAGSRRSKSYEGHFERPYYVERIDSADVLVQNEDINLQKFSGYKLYNTIHKVAYRPNQFNRINYGFYFSTTSNIPRYDRLTITEENSDSLTYADWHYGPQRWLMHNLSFTNFKSNPFYDQMKINWSYQNYQESRHDRKFGSDLLRNREEKVNIMTTSIDFEKDLSDTQTLFYGVDGFYNDIQSIGHRVNLTTGDLFPAQSRYPDGGSKYNALAGYASYQNKLSDKWNLNIGMRYNAVFLQASTDSPVEAIEDTEVNTINQAVTGSFGTTFNPSKKTKLYASIASGFRSPNIDDVGKLFELDDETLIVPNPDLKPEYVYSQEAGFSQRFGDKVEFSFVAYHSYLTNAIVRGPYEYDELSFIVIESDTSHIRSQVNSERARTYGGTARIKYAITPTLGFASVINVNEGRDISNDQPLRHSTPVFGQTSFNYSKNSLQVIISSDYHFSKDADSIPITEIVDKPHIYTDEGSPGWITVDVRAGYGFFDNVLSLQMGVENLLDQHYRTYSSGISAPGRNIYLNTKVIF